MKDKEEEKKIRKLARLYQRILENKKGREYVATIIECQNNKDEYERQIHIVDARLRNAEMKLMNKFKIDFQQWMNISILTRMEGIEKFLKRTK